jgi:probable F420-dependent oxidoreductase
VALVPLRPFRFSLQVAAANSRLEWVELAQTAESVGFSLLVTPDHLADCFSALPPLITAAEATASLRVGTLVLNNDLRHPSLLAREAATIDLLTDGRFELGIGAGHSFTEYQRNGIGFDSAPVRIARLSESVQLLRRLLDGESVDFDGDYYQLTGETCFPRPVQKHIPIVIGGSGKRLLAAAARFADTIGLTGLGRTLDDGQHHEPSGFPAKVVDQQIDWVLSHAADRIDDLEIQALVQAVVVTDIPQRVAKEFAEERLAPLSPEDVLDTPYLMIGTQTGLMEKMQDGRERWGISHYTFRARDLEEVAPIVEALAGT